MRYFLLLSALLLTATLAAQDSTYETDYEIALSKGKDILMVFGGSDWCRPCMKFKQEVLDQPSFAAFAKDRVTVLYLDFPRKKKNRLTPYLTEQNESLAEQYNAEDQFPKVLLLGANGRVKQTLDYNGKQSAEEFIRRVKDAL